jgi:hypothetical protein
LRSVNNGVCCFQHQKQEQKEHAEKEEQQEHEEIDEPKSAPVPVWIPQFSDKQGDNPSAEKIGGLPGVTNSNSSAWPQLKGKPAVFVMQFRDPRFGPSLGQFTQLFVPHEDDIDGDGDQVHFQTINEQDVSKLVFPKKHPSGALYAPKARVIKSWLESEETFDEMFGEAGGPSENAYRSEKIGGIGETCQGINYTLFIQNLFPGEWGDAGSLHVSDEGLMFGDMW